MIKQSEEIRYQNQLAYLCRRRGLVSEAMIVGVDQAIFAKQFMMEWGGDFLHLIDPYLPQETGGPRTADMLVATMAMMPYHGKFKFYMLPSVEAAQTLPKTIKTQFIYLAANDGYNQVRMDLDAWWRRLPDNGILAGQDYDRNHRGVMQAVDEFMETWKVNARMIFARESASWYIYKTEPTEFTVLFE